VVVAPPAGANPGPLLNGGASSRISLTAKITRFRATASGVVAQGMLTGKLRSGTSVSRDSAPVSFAVAAKPRAGRCNVIILRLAPLDLELLGVQVTTSDISLDVYGLKGRVLGDLFCALSHAKVCGLAGGGGVNSLAGLQSLLSSRGVNLSTAQI
jgi:hypothetical protein